MAKHWNEKRVPADAPEGWRFDRCDEAWAEGYNACLAAYRHWLDGIARQQAEEIRRLTP